MCTLSSKSKSSSVKTCPSSLRFSTRSIFIWIWSEVRLPFHRSFPSALQIPSRIWLGFWLWEVQILPVLLLTGSTCPSSRDCLCNIFSCRLLFGPTVVTYFACSKGFIYWLRSYVYVYSCNFPRLLFVYHCFFYWSFSVLLAYFCIL